MDTETVKTAELEGVVLNWAVAQCEKMDGRCKNACVLTVRGVPVVFHDPDYARMYRPSTDWRQGGPLIEEHEVRLQLPGNVRAPSGDVTPWRAVVDGGFNAFGLTPLIAVCRAIVSAKLGDEIEAPSVLVEKHG